MGKPAASKQSVSSATPPETAPMDSTNPLVPSNPASEAAPTAAEHPASSSTPPVPPPTTTTAPTAVPETAPTAAPTPPASTPPEAPPPAPPAPAQPSPPDPFDLGSLRLGSDLASGLGVKKVINTIPVRKPSKDEWFRRRAGEDWMLTTAALEVEKGVERTTYLLARDLWAEYSAEITPVVLYVCVNRQGDLFVWRVKLPGPDGRTNTWTDSALQIAKGAETMWSRMRADMSAGMYSHYVIKEEAVPTEPAWPADLTLTEIIKIAFRGRLIETVDHPVLRELRGEL
jgi:hypothetical protein